MVFQGSSWREMVFEVMSVVLEITVPDPTLGPGHPAPQGSWLGCTSIMTRAHRLVDKCVRERWLSLVNLGGRQKSDAEFD